MGKLVHAGGGLVLRVARTSKTGKTTVVERALASFVSTLSVSHYDKNKCLAYVCNGVLGWKS